MFPLAMMPDQVAKWLNQLISLSSINWCLTFFGNHQYSHRENCEKLKWLWSAQNHGA